ncbi:MAG: methyltransferase [Candidatus Latescibacteria bacterium]|nr:methyltransferase [Candidatus Latescibacterota bacterium]
MSFIRSHRDALNTFFQYLKLQTPDNRAGADKAAKIEQILAFFEIVHAQVRRYSSKRRLVFIDSGAGNGYLSFLVYYFYRHLDQRPVAIHCLDTNARLMEKGRRRGRNLGFEHLHFHTCDIAAFSHPGPVDMVYALHACDAATDKALYLGVRQQARCILAVACCQHQVRRQLRGHPYTGITKHRVFKEKLVYMVGDVLRGLLLEMRGYKVDMVEFASTRHTDKNIMIRARKQGGADAEERRREYLQIRDEFHVTPALEGLLNQQDAGP